MKMGHWKTVLPFLCSVTYCWWFCITDGANAALVDTQSVPCCANGVYLNQTYQCTDGQNVTLTCTSFKAVLDPVVHTYRKFDIDAETGELTTSYFTVKNTSAYCLNDLETENGTTYQVAIVCDESRTYIWELEFTETVKWYNYVRLAQLVSSVCLFLTALVYAMLPELQDVHGVCIFHFSANMGANFFFFPLLLSDAEYLPLHVCITEAYITYFFVLSAFFWMHILAYNTWKLSKGCRMERDRELTKYKIAGYGSPAILITLSVVSAHFQGLFDTSMYTCWAHQRSNLEALVGLPVFILFVGNVFYFFDASRRLWKAYKQQTHVTTLKGLSYRCWLYVKLFLVCGLLWGVHAFASWWLLVGFTTELVMTFISSLQGLFIFFILVVTRKKVLRGLARLECCGRQIFPHAWKNMKDEETDVAPLDPQQQQNNNNTINNGNLGNNISNAA